jgi:hypothetical protein
MKEDTADAVANRVRPATRQIIFAVLLGAVTLALLANFARSVASGPDMRSALFLRSLYEDTAGEVVRQYRVALKHKNKEELCVVAGMIASVYAHAHEMSEALAWKEQEGRDCSAARMESVWADVGAR